MTFQLNLLVPEALVRGCLWLGPHWAPGPGCRASIGTSGRTFRSFGSSASSCSSADLVSYFL